MGSYEIYFHPSYTGFIQATTKNRNLHVFYILDVHYTAILSKQNSDELTNPSFYYITMKIMQMSFSASDSQIRAKAKSTDLCLDGRKNLSIGNEATFYN